MGAGPMRSGSIGRVGEADVATEVYEPSTFPDGRRADREEDLRGSRRPQVAALARVQAATANSC